MSSGLMDEGRIKLAVAMGWQELYHTPGRWFNDDKPQEECRATEHLPNPFTDANDDYAVLEWMRGDEDGPETAEWRAFKDFFIEVTGDWNIWNYKIGDFARAALGVIARQQDQK